MPKILMIEDEPGIRAFVVPYLKKAGFEVDETDNGKTGLGMAQRNHYALILLDIMLPGLDGLTVCTEIRRKSRVPILMLTAKSEEGDIVRGFEAGADDYLTKPFSPRELTARIKALLARCSPELPRMASFGPISVDATSIRAFLDETLLSLTPKEFDLLQFLVSHPGLVYSREQLLAQIWGYGYFGDTRTVDTHIKQLREKLGEHRDLLITVWGRGYKLGS